jgi:hypothetical protein
MGGVPIGAVGDRFWTSIGDEVGAMLATPGVDFSAEVVVPIEITLGDAGIFDTIEVSAAQVLEIAFSKGSGRHLVRPWLRLAALAIAEPSRVREAIVIARSEKKDETVAVDRFVLAGESEADRLASATRVLTFALGVHQRALCSPLPLFEYASWADLTKSSHVNTGLNSDLKNPSAAAIFGDRGFADFTNAADVFSPLHPIDQDFATSGTRFQAYARALQGCFAETTVTK